MDETRFCSWHQLVLTPQEHLKLVLVVHFDGASRKALIGAELRELVSDDLLALSAGAAFPLVDVEHHAMQALGHYVDVAKAMLEAEPRQGGEPPARGSQEPFPAPSEDHVEF